MWIAVVVRSSQKTPRMREDYYWHFFLRTAVCASLVIWKRFWRKRQWMRVQDVFFVAFAAAFIVFLNHYGITWWIQIGMQRCTKGQCRTQCSTVEGLSTQGAQSSTSSTKVPGRYATKWSNPLHPLPFDKAVISGIVGRGRVIACNRSVLFNAPVDMLVTIFIQIG